ncbi:MAG: RNA polymerase sigma factor SigZ, partial [Gammaproteobacteria bacterium]
TRQTPITVDARRNMPSKDYSTGLAWKEHREQLLRFVRRRLTDGSAAEDIVQEVLLKAHSQLHSLENPSSLRAWLYQITRNQLIDYYRRLKPTVALPPQLQDQLAPELDTEQERELAACLRPLLGSIPEPYREALQLADFDEMRQRDIAARLGLSLSGAKSRVQRARKLLRQELLACCHVELDRRGGTVDFVSSEECRCCAANQTTAQATR